jgi:hypothetical protein
VKIPFDEPEDPKEREVDLDKIEELEVVPIIKDNEEDCDDEKGVFPCEFIQSNNYMEILSKTDPFPQHAFNNMMDKSKMSDTNYAKFLNDWDELKDRLTLERMYVWMGLP